MTQTLTSFSLFTRADALLWWLGDRLHRRASVRVSIRLDRTAPGAHLIWDIQNVGTDPITLTELVVRGRRATNRRPFARAPLLAPGDEIRLPTDVDWTLLGLRSLHVVDSMGRRYSPPRAERRAVYDQLRELIDHRATTNARDFLFGAADLAFGMLLLALGFFMLMWVIATG